MRLRACSREKEVRELLGRGAWPAACPPALHAHVRGCRACADLVLVTGVFQRERALSAAPHAIGSPGLLWWRAQLRRRNQAVERIARPLQGAQIFALAVLLLAGIGFVFASLRQGAGWLSGLWVFLHTGTQHLETLWSLALTPSSWNWIVLLPALAALALLGGALAYLATEKQ